jgi:hypothetical protein
MLPAVLGDYGFERRMNLARLTQDT